MGISGSWAQRNAQPYTGAAKWGDGVHPIHAVRDQGRGKTIGIRANLLPYGQPSDVVSDALTARDIDYVCEDYVDSPLAGEYYRYQDDYPRWDQTTPQFRGATNSPAMGETPAWGVHYDADPSDIWPLPGPTAGTQQWLDVDHGEAAELNTAIAVPTMPVTGGWRSKQRGALAVPDGQDPSQPGYTGAINTARVQGQGVQQLDNLRATTRGTDTPRSAIRSRTAGMVAKDYARSFGLGGGAGTPDMRPYQQTAGLRRPWYTRRAALPPDEAHTWNEMEGRYPLQRQIPADPYQGDPEDAAGPATVSDWGF